MLQLVEVSNYIEEQNEKRDLWVDNDDPKELAKMILDESKELVDSIDEAMVTDNVFEVASEIGDVGYLLLALCEKLGINLMEAVEMKIIRNSYKYPDHVLSNGRDYKEAASVTKKAWKDLGGDAAFSHIYLDHLANVDDEQQPGDDREKKYPHNIL